MSRNADQNKAVNRNSVKAVRLHGTSIISDVTSEMGWEDVYQLLRNKYRLPGSVAGRITHHVLRVLGREELHLVDSNGKVIR